MKKTDKKEEIILDAVLGNTLDCATFQATLANGHEIVAFSSPRRPVSALGLHSGQTVRVSLSPYDMLKGIILKENQIGFDHEST